MAPRPRLVAALGLAAALGLGALEARAVAPERFDFYDRGPYRPGVPRPAEVLGYEPGTFHTSYGNMERYVEALVRGAPDRLAREPFGLSYEFRERSLLVVTSLDNHRRLSQIREATAKLADPRRLAAPSEAERLIRETPVTVWLNYSIHGDESASFEAMAQVAYQLAAGEDSTTRAILERCVVVINLAHNPDGHERFVTWINALGTGDPDPMALEQQRQQPWGIGGRTNHYQFDLNRDALAMSQVESRQMSAAVRRWRPQVFVDHHGQTASYFFPPTAPPLNPALPSDENGKWNEIFGRANAAAFDRYGWNYYVRDVFDFFYPGFWDTWPALLGAIGMTYETDGGGNLAMRRDDETVVTLLDGIRRHFTASLATCAAAAANREARLADFHRFAATAVEEGRRGPVRAYAFEPGADPVRAAALAENLLNAGAEVRWVPAPFRVRARPVWQESAASDEGAKRADARAGAAARGKPAAAASVASSPAASASGGSNSGATGGSRPAASSHYFFERGAFVVDLAQPAGRLARTLIERDAPLDTAFARRQLAKYERNLERGKRAPKEPYDFYDVTAWSLPVAYGIETFALGDVPAGGVLLAPPAPGEPRPGEERLPDSLAVGVPMTARVSEVGPLEIRAASGEVALDLSGRIEGGPARTAYVWGYASDGAARLALRLLQEGFKVATATRPLEAGGRSFPRGSFVARVERNPEELHERIAELARLCGVSVLAVHSAYIESGDTGVGSETVASLERPRIAVLADGPVSPTAYGELWFLLERRLGVRFTALRVSAIAKAELDRYNAIVIPDGEAAALARELGENGVSALKDWVSRGNVLVCLSRAAEFPTLEEVKLSSARAIGTEKKKKKKDEEEPEPARPDSAARERERRPEYVPGAAFWASLDPMHFLNYGQPSPRIPVLLQGRLFLEPSIEGVNPARFDRKPLRLSGWAWPETERRVEGAAYAVDEPTGRGHVLMIAGRPIFRLFWRTTERMLVNAILFGPTLE